MKKASLRLPAAVSLSSGLTKLAKLTLANQNDLTHINRGIFDILSDKSLLIAAYQRIKSKPGMATMGADKETLDGINLKYFIQLEKDLRTGKFQFRPSRRVGIPKPLKRGQTKPDLRYLRVRSPRDKIVQQAMFMILEAIFEPTFSTHSHGFRPGKGCGSALKEVKYTFQAAN